MHKHLSTPHPPFCIITPTTLQSHPHTPHPSSLTTAQHALHTPGAPSMGDDIHDLSDILANALSAQASLPLAGAPTEGEGGMAMFTASSLADLLRSQGPEGFTDLLTTVSKRLSSKPMSDAGA